MIWNPLLIDILQFLYQKDNLNYLNRGFSLFDKGNLKYLGVAYITLEDEGSLEAALLHNEEEFMERKVKITKAKP